MIFGSVCSGIEAASVAWGKLGWKSAFFSEIEKFPSKVLANHHPDVPNLGDMTKFQEWKNYEIRLLCGGTPCQSFSIAGLRKGLDDIRGNLMLTFAEMAARFRPQWIFWENVPGVLSSNGGRDFAAFLGLISGQTVHVPKGGWGKSGIIPGYKNAYGIAYRVFDAQYFGVAQRRRRVFVVGYLGNWRPAAAVLLERESLQGHPAPRRKAGEKIAPCVTNGPPFSRTGNERVEAEAMVVWETSPTLDSSAVGFSRIGDIRGQDPVIPCKIWPAEVAPTLDAAYGEKMGLENQHINAGGGCSSIARCLTGSNQRIDAETETLIPCQGGIFEVAHTLKGEGFDASEDGTGRQNLVPIAFSSKDYGNDATNDLSPTLRAMGHADSHANGGGQMAVAYAIQERAICENPDAGPDGIGVRSDDSAYTLEARSVPQAVAFQQNQLGEVRTGAVSGTLNTNSNASGRNTPMALSGMAVRRLTPVECERLQGFPDGYTNVPDANGKPAADGPRYKALGNSWAVPNVEWIGRRIDAVDKFMRGEA